MHCSARGTPGINVLTKLAMANSVPVASKKSTYKKVTSAIHRDPFLKPLKSNAAPVRRKDGTATTCLKYSQRASPVPPMPAVHIAACTSQDVLQFEGFVKGHVKGYEQGREDLCKKNSE